MNIERSGEQRPVGDAEEGGDRLGLPAPGEVGRGPVSIRDDRVLFLVLGAGAALVVAALLVVALVRTLSGGDEPVDADGGPSGPLAEIVPNVAASPVLLAPEEQATQLSDLLAQRRHDVATPSPAAMLCAAVVLDEPLEVAGRWERDGQEVASTSQSPVGAPGFGDCVDDGGGPLDEGVYQFLVTDAEGFESAAGTIVVGADVVRQPFVNAGTEPICALRVAPSRAGYFDAYDLRPQPLLPGQSITIALADVDHDVQAHACGADGGQVASAELDPDEATAHPLGGQ